MTFKFWKGKEFTKTITSFGKNFVKSAKALYNGEGKGLQKHAGKILLGAAAFSTIFGVINSVSSSHKPSEKTASDVIDKNNRYEVN